jgi:hypothetical protein
METKYTLNFSSLGGKGVNIYLAPQGDGNQGSHRQYPQTNFRVNIYLAPQGDGNILLAEDKAALD